MEIIYKFYKLVLISYTSLQTGDESEIPKISKAYLVRHIIIGLGKTGEIVCKMSTQASN